MLPGFVQVMEPVLGKQVPRQENTVYQVKWDGVRMLAFVNNEQVVLQNRRGRIKTDTFPELGCLGGLSGQPMILDGEVVSIRAGRPDFGQILRRNFASYPGPGAPPISYVVFDILVSEGKDVRGEPLFMRQSILANLSLPIGPVSLIDNFPDGDKLFQLTSERGWEGIVAKVLGSPYVSGKSPYWKKIKHTKNGLFTIVGYITNHGQLASLVLADDFGSGLTLTGSVGSGLSNEGRKILADLLGGLVTQEPPVAAKKVHLNWQWVKPLLQAEVDFMEWTESLTLRAPVFRGLFLEGKRFELP